MEQKTFSTMTQKEREKIMSSTFRIAYLVAMGLSVKTNKPCPVCRNLMLDLLDGELLCPHCDYHGKDVYEEHPKNEPVSNDGVNPRLGALFSAFTRLFNRR